VSLNFVFSILLSIVLLGCASLNPNRKIASASPTPFELVNKGYNLSGQINEVPGSDRIAIFFHGSGVQDRWETMPAEMTLDGKPSPTFKIISDELNKNGISTCVFDKRAFKEKGTPQYEAALKTHTFENIKSDANAVFNYVESLKRYKKIILIGHSEGTVTASEISFEHKGDDQISSIVLIGVLAENLKDSLQHQLTDVMAKNSFAAADLNHDGKIYPQEVPDNLKAGLPIDKIDTQKKGYITFNDLMAVLTPQADQFMKAVQLAPADTIIMNKPVQWYRDLFNRKTLIERANEYSYPVLIAHGELDANVFYKTNAVPLDQKLRALKKDVTLTSFPSYGHGLSPAKNGEPTLGPLQEDALIVLSKWIQEH